MFHLSLFSRIIYSSVNKDIMIKSLLQKKQPPGKEWREGSLENCDRREDMHNNEEWIANNISELMSHLLQRYDRRIRPYFESKAGV